MKKLLSVLAVMLSVVSVSACASSVTAEKTVKKAEASALDPTVMAALEAANAARKKAASVDGEWRDTGKLIKKAKALAEKGKTAEAIKLAKKAQQQGELGYAQAKAQANAGPRF
ncbi:MAG TPA: SoxXA-binding protein [Gammaproteobacteria bacterium]|nr:SoxXA-binding protein [Gammaproteobacteria bacterium]